METQPQLLLLQKTMMLIEGIGRQLDPSVNIWTLARPIVEQWMRENRGPEAQLRQQIDTLIEVLQDVPRVLRGLDRIVGNWTGEGVKLHAESIAAQASHWVRLLPLVVIPLGLGGLALVAIALAVIFG
jgi:ubiquinone biosynthesis protein